MEKAGEGTYWHTEGYVIPGSFHRQDLCGKMLVIIVNLGKTLERAAVPIG